MTRAIPPAIPSDIPVEAPSVTEDDIARLVDHFYGLVRDDADLGPIFAAKIADWGPHLTTMRDFWSSVMRKTGRFHGQPMPKHAALVPLVTPRHFEVWLALFRQAAAEVCTPAAAAAFIDRAERIAQSLQLGMYGLSARGPGLPVRPSAP